MHRYLGSVAALALLATLCSPAQAVSTNPVRTVTSPTSTSWSFGNAVATNGTLVVTGAPLDPATGDSEGAVYVHTYVTSQGWVEVAQLTAPTLGQPQANAKFGAAVAISDNLDLIAVGAPDYDLPGVVNAGAVFVYGRGSSGTYVLLQTIFQPQNASPYAAFGKSVAITDNYLLIGAPYTDMPSGINGNLLESAGAAYLYYQGSPTDPVSWRFISELTNTTWPEANEYFGYSVALSPSHPWWGEMAVVGAPYSDANGTDSGAVYVFDTAPSCPSEQSGVKIVDSAVSAYDHFGTSVSASRDLIGIGAPGTDLVAKPDAGSSYVWQIDNLTQSRVTIFTAFDGNTNMQQAYAKFGTSVSLDAEFSGGGKDKFTLVVGAPFMDINGYDWVGAAFFMERLSSSSTDYSMRVPPALASTASARNGNRVSTRKGRSMVAPEYQKVVHEYQTTNN